MTRLTNAKRMMRAGRTAVAVLTASAAAALLPALPAAAQDGVEDFPPERSMGEGPFDRVILRGGYLIDGTGAPTQGPVDIVIENDRITRIKVVGAPKLAIEEENRPPLEGGREIDVSGKYILPGFVDTHLHLHSLAAGQDVPAEYVLKLWFSHGVTSGRTVGGHRDDGGEWLRSVQSGLEGNEITGPRIHIFPMFRNDATYSIDTPEAARRRIREIAEQGSAGVKFLGAPAGILFAALEEAEELGLKTTMHHAQLDVVHANVLDTSSHGLDSMEHWYGLPEALFTDKQIQQYPNDYIYHNEQHRFGEAGRLWTQAAEPGSERWNAVMSTLLERDFALSPTFTAYRTSRDFMRMSRAIWHETYTMPALWDWYRPNRDAHGSYWFYWTLEDEIAWKENYRLWMRFVNAYKNRGGLVGVGSDAGYIYNLYGFGYIQEMELLREAGFSPLEVIHAATLQGAKILGIDDEVGSVQVGKKADFVIVDENPLANLHVLLGTGWIKLNDETGEVERVGGIRHVIKDGIVYDGRALRRRIREMVAASKRERGIAPGPMPVATVPAEQ